MFTKEQIQKMKAEGRTVEKAVSGDELLGPLKHLPGIWKNTPSLNGRGLNMISLPFKGVEPVSGEELEYRLLVNQYNEELTFTFVDKGVPNRGVVLENNNFDPDCPDPSGDPDQLVVALDYQQVIHQLDAEDFPKSGKEGKPGAAIHHEPGLWLHMRDERTQGIDIARLSTVPHGDSVLALGRSKGPLDGPPEIPYVDGLFIGDTRDREDPYLAPYVHFQDCHFHGFDPFNPHLQLEFLNKKLAYDGIKILRTTTLEVDTTIETGGIKNIPFIVKQANAKSMKSTFWIMEVDDHGTEKLLLQYLQIVILDFLPREDGHPGLVRWPHVSINTLEKVVKGKVD